MTASVMDKQIAAASALVASAQRIVVLTGAGISTDSGIPDFRGPNGLWTKDPSAERLANIDTYVSDPEVRRRAWRSRIDSPTWQAEPNAGHRSLVTLERRGQLNLLVTQNVDGLHQAGGHDPTLIVEFHGTMREVVCLRCSDRQPMDDVLDRVRGGEDDPICLAELPDGSPCGGMLKSATISFGQIPDPEDRRRAEEATMAADLLLAIGSTLTVFPAAGVVPLAYRFAVPIVIVNAEPTPYDEIAEVVLHASISDVLPQIIEGSRRDLDPNADSEAEASSPCSRDDT